MSVITCKADIDYPEIIDVYYFNIHTDRVYSDEEKIGFISLNGDSISFAISRLMLERNLCAECACTNQAFPENLNPQKRIDELKIDLNSKKHKYFFRIILTRDYKKKPIFRIDYIEKINDEKKFKNSNKFLIKKSILDTTYNHSETTINMLTNKGYLAKQLSEKTIPIPPPPPLKFLTSATTFNVFYKGIENPFAVVIPNVPIEKIAIKITNASYQGSNGKYKVFPKKVGKCYVYVYSFTNNDSILVGRHYYRIKSIPTPTVYLSGRTNFDTISKSYLSNGVLNAKCISFPFDIRFRISSFRCTIKSSEMQKSFNIKGNRITSELKNAFKDIKEGDQIIFDEMSAIHRKIEYKLEKMTLIYRRK